MKTSLRRTVKYSQMRILIVDDDDDDFILLEDLLFEAIGKANEILWAQSYDHALELIEHSDFDFYFLDNRLGAKLGLDLIAEIKQRFNIAPPIIMLSGVDDHQTDITAMELGADDYLIKSQLTAPLLERTIRYTLRDKSLEYRLGKLAHFDSLTGLYNRSIFDELLRTALDQSQREKQQFALVTLDLDKFKFINDNYGHPAGDQILIKVATRLKNNVRSSDNVARLGGDEFSLILRDVKNEGGFLKLIENLIGIFEQPFQIDSKPISVTTSMGIAIFPNDSHTVEDLVSYSDMAMYQAKNNGRNTFSFYNQELHKKTQHKRQLEVALQTALIENKFELHYQAITLLNDGSLSSFEALLRWPDGRGGFHNTEQFITVAEESSLILDIGNWVFKQACCQLTLWYQQGFKNRKISINVSAHQFHSNHFVSMVTDFITEHPEIAPLLIFELTERKPLEISDENINKLQQLADLGICFSVDDFGIGHSSISYLRAFPLSTIKIDRSIISQILSSKEDLALCNAIISLGKALSLSVIAEGVETKEISSKLQELGCPRAQGYLYSYPLSLSDLESWLVKYESNRHINVAS
jgi:diguanylate cyclase (GGDEF)-like protein